MQTARQHGVQWPHHVGHVGRIVIWIVLVPDLHLAGTSAYAVACVKSTALTHMRQSAHVSLAHFVSRLCSLPSREGQESADAPHQPFPQKKNSPRKWISRRYGQHQALSGCQHAAKAMVSIHRFVNCQPPPGVDPRLIGFGLALASCRRAASTHRRRSRRRGKHAPRYSATHANECQCMGIGVSTAIGAVEQAPWGMGRKEFTCLRNLISLK